MADDYQLSFPWSDVDTAAEYLNCPVVFTEENNVIAASMSGAEIYVLLSDVTHNYNIYAIDAAGRQPCAMTVKPNSTVADVKFSIVDGTTLYIYTLTGGGSTVTVETVDVSASSGSLFWITLSLVDSTWEMDCSYSDIAAAQSANKVILAKAGTNVFYAVGDPTDDGLTVSRTCFDANGAWIDGFIIDSTDDSVTRISPITVTADNVVKYTAQNLSAAQQAQACANIGAAKKLLVTFGMVHGSIVADVSYAEIDAAVAANQVIEAAYGYFRGPMVYMDSDKAVFVTTGLPSDPTIYTLSISSSDVVSGTANAPLLGEIQVSKRADMTSPVGVDASGKLWSVPGGSAALDYITPQMFGAIGDGETDDYDAFVACLSYASTNSVPIKIVSNHFVGTALVFSGVQIVSDYKYTILFPDHVSPLVTIESKTVVNNLRVECDAYNYDTTEAIIGVLVKGSQCRLNNVEVRNVFRGIQVGYSAIGVAYNYFHQCYVRNCAEGIYIIGTGTNGYTNECAFTECTVRIDTTIKTALTTAGLNDRYAVTLERDSSTSKNLNCHRFIDCNVENCFNGFSVRAYYCMFLNNRTDGNNIYYYFHQTNGGYNTVICAHGTAWDSSVQRIYEVNDSNSELRNNFINIRNYPLTIDRMKFPHHSTQYKPTPGSTEKGECYFDTTMGQPQWWTGTTWVGAEPSAVKFTSQNLTASEKAQACENIGAAVEPTVVALSGSTPIVSEAANNTIYEAGECTSLTVSARATNAAFSLKFNSPSQFATDLFLPQGVALPDGFETEANHHYEINVDRDGWACVQSWSLS